jgi:hypothetical protein
MKIEARGWQKKLKSLGLSNHKQLVELKLSSPHMPSSLLSVNQQCQLLGVNRSSVFFNCFGGLHGNFSVSKEGFLPIL